jgi:hypothetical protein
MTGVHVITAGLALQLPNSPFDKRRLGPPVPKLVLYRGRWMLLFRWLTLHAAHQQWLLISWYLMQLGGLAMHVCQILSTCQGLPVAWDLCWSSLPSRCL